jgi:3-phytase
LETIVADAYHQALYIPDENGRTGVYAFAPNGEPDMRTETNVFGDTVFGADAEGILLYTCPATGGGDDGRGLIVVSDQLPDLTEFEVFDRQTKEHLGAFRLTGVSNTDGIGSTQQAMPMYPLGVFAAVNDDRSVAGIGWDSILEATGISCASQG